MCQLAAYVGDRPIAPLLLRAIENQEPYIGGYATGLGVIDDGILKVEKDRGHVRKVMSSTKISELEGTTGMSHSRHTSKAKNRPDLNTQAMAHPFIDGTGTLALMHNGGIRGYRELWEGLKEGHEFASYSEEADDLTDSEVAVHMLRDYLDEGLSMEEGLRRLAQSINGEFLFGVFSSEHPETIWIANWHNPCVVGLGDDEAMFCSSPIGFYDVRDEFDKIFTPPRNSIIKLTRGRAEITTMDPKRKIPRLKLNRNILAERILRALERTGRLEIREISRALHPEGWAEAFGLSSETWRDIRRDGILFNNEYFDILETMVSDGFLSEEVSLVSEAGVPDIPKFFYSLV